MVFYITLCGQSHKVNDAKTSEGLSMELNTRSRIVSASFHTSGCWQKSLWEKQMKVGAGQAQIDGAILTVLCGLCAENYCYTNSKFQVYQSNPLQQEILAEKQCICRKWCGTQVSCLSIYIWSIFFKNKKLFHLKKGLCNRAIKICCFQIIFI